VAGNLGGVKIHAVANALEKQLHLGGDVSTELGNFCEVWNAFLMAVVVPQE
jgi:hypothetical protein